MKRLVMVALIFVALLFISRCAFAQDKSQHNVFKITGILHNVDVKRVYLTYSTGEVNRPAINDSAEVVNNTYTFTHPITNCTFGLLKTNNPAQGLALVVLAPETFTLTHDGNFTNPAITGSKLNADYKAITAEAAARKTNEVYADYIRKNPSSPLALFALKRYAVEGHSIDVEKAAPLFKLLPDAVKNSEEGKDIEKQISYTKVFMATSAIGKQAKDFTLSDTAGRPVSLSSFKGKYVLLDFWASWCAPCRADNPHLKAAYAKYHSQGFDILSVSADVASAKGKWLKAIHDDKIGAWTHVADLDNKVNSAIKLYGIQGIPQNYLIDPDGNIIAMSLRGGTLETELEKIYKKN